MRQIAVIGLAAYTLLVAQPVLAADGRHTAAAVGGGAGLLVGGLIGAFLASPSSSTPQPRQQPMPQPVYVVQPPQPTVIQYITIQPGNAPPSVTSRWYCNCVDSRR